MKIKEGEKLPNSKVFIMSKDGPKEISMHEVIGKENIIKNENFFIASAHQSIFETFFLQTIIQSPIFILKKELLKIPVFGWHLKKINSIAIERDKTTKENLGFFENFQQF